MEVLYGDCPNCGMQLDMGDLIRWEGATGREECYCSYCEKVVVYTFVEVAGCHWCETPNSIRYDADEGVHYCGKCSSLCIGEDDQCFSVLVETAVEGE